MAFGQFNQDCADGHSKNARDGFNQAAKRLIEVLNLRVFRGLVFNFAAISISTN